MEMPVCTVCTVCTVCIKVVSSDGEFIPRRVLRNTENVVMDKKPAIVSVRHVKISFSS